MSETRQCVFCGSNNLELIDREGIFYFCHACNRKVTDEDYTFAMTLLLLFKASNDVENMQTVFPIISNLMMYLYTKDSRFLIEPSNLAREIYEGVVNNDRGD